MSKLNSKAQNLLDSCLSTESPESKAKIYEIIAVSGLDATDPMFLVLALTGQLRVMLESAPAELSQILTSSKLQSDINIQKIDEAIKRVEEIQLAQVDIVRDNLKQISKKSGEDIKQAGMATVSGISEAYEEAFKQVNRITEQTKQISAKITELKNSIEHTQFENSQLTRTLAGLFESPVKTLQAISSEVTLAVSQVQRVQNNSTLWLAFRWFFPVVALVFMFCFGFLVSSRLSELKYNDADYSLGYNLVDWNRERILKCRQDENLKCTLWLSPPKPPKDK